MLDSFGWVAGEVTRLITCLKCSDESNQCDLDVLLQEFSRHRMLALGYVLKRDLESRGGDNYCTQVLACCLYGGIGLDSLEVQKEQFPWTLLKYEGKSPSSKILPVSQMAKESILHVLVGNVATATNVVSSNIGFCVYAQIAHFLLKA